jgi:hypothetical protein
MRRAAFTLALLLTVGQILPLPPRIGQQIRVAGKRKILSQVKDAYPPLARKMNPIVKLVAVVGPDGTVVRTELIGGSPVLGAVCRGCDR